MNTPDHSAACAASPHFCICSLSRPGSITPEGEKPKLMAIPPRDWPISQQFGPNPPGLVTMDNITVDPDTANLFKEPGTLVADGGWGLRQDHLTAADLPEIRVKRGGIKYPSAHELLPKVRAERDTAREQARFWRRAALTVGGIYAIDLALTVIQRLGWI